jgi:uncharacterized protein YjdB
MTIRDNALPKFNRARAKIQQVGLRRYSVTLRRRIWSGGRVGEGDVTNEDIVITPSPKVRLAKPLATQMEYIMTSGGTIRTRVYEIDKITPRFTDRNGAVGGYTPEQLRMVVPAGALNVEPVVILVGDDGQARECTQITVDDDRAFSYSMMVIEKDGSSVPIVSIAIAPTAPIVVVGQSLQLTAIGTFADGNSYDVTNLVKWVSAAPAIASVDLLGLAKGLAPGTTPVTASIIGVASAPAALTVQ